MHPGLRTIDCGGGSGSGNSSNSLKKLFMGLLSNSGEESSNSGSSRRGASKRLRGRGIHSGRAACDDDDEDYEPEKVRSTHIHCPLPGTI